jgi:hypothetical protein
VAHRHGAPLPRPKGLSSLKRLGKFVLRVLYQVPNEDQTLKTIILKYVTKTKTGSFEYRRQVPVSLRERLGRYEFKKVLGLSEPKAIKRWPSYNDGWSESKRTPKAPASRAATTIC